MRFIDSEAGLEQVASAVAGAKTAYLDTEFESRKSGITLCLVQITTGDETYLIDALRLRRLHALAPVLGAVDCEWVLHAGQQDLPLLLDALGIQAPPRLFDTQVAWSLLTPEASVSLAYLQYRVTGLRLMKSHQADDWKRRPLPSAQLAYAASDVEHLPDIHQKLTQDAAALNRIPLIREASRESLSGRVSAPTYLQLDSFRNAWQLNVRAQAALKRLIRWYNEELDENARSLAPSPKVFLSIASRGARNSQELSRIKGMPARWVQRQGDALVSMLQDAAQEANGDDFVPIDPPPYATYEGIRLEAWLAQARACLCEELQVSPEFCLPSRLVSGMRDEIRAGANAARGVRALTGWRRELFEEAYQTYCDEHAGELPPLPS